MLFYKSEKNLKCSILCLMITTILLLASNPAETDSLRLAKEFREIKESLKLSLHEDSFRIVQGEAVRSKDLRRLVLENKPQIVHFSGHGSEQGIVLENYFGKRKVVSGRALASLFELFDSVHCVVLNACYSSVQAQAIVKVTPYVIGMTKPVSDDVAIQFSTGFYDGLGSTLDIESAFEFGVNAIELNRSPDNLLNGNKSRSFELDEDSVNSAENEVNTPILLKSDIQRPLARLSPSDKEGNDELKSNSSVKNKVAAITPAQVLLKLGGRFIDGLNHKMKPVTRSYNPFTRLAIAVWRFVKSILGFVFIIVVIYIGIRLFGDDEMLQGLDKVQHRAFIGWDRLMGYLKNIQ